MAALRRAGHVRKFNTLEDARAAFRQTMEMARSGSISDNVWYPDGCGTSIHVDLKNAFLEMHEKHGDHFRDPDAALEALLQDSR